MSSDAGSRVRRIRLELAYDGTDFAGFQAQRDQRTVQGELESILTRLQGGGRVVVRGAGRTDAGVHARRQVVDFRIDSRLDDEAMGQSLRRLLPVDLRPLALATVSDRFDAQRQARLKSYRYRLDRTRHGDPFRVRYALHHPGELDRTRLETALARLPGRRDWSGFTDSRCRIRDKVRTLSVARYEEEPEGGRFVFAADGFLTYMVRNMVGTLLEIAAGRMEPERIDSILQSGDRRLGGPTAAARGLWLWRVEYEDS